MRRKRLQLLACPRVPKLDIAEGLLAWLSEEFPVRTDRQGDNAIPNGLCLPVRGELESLSVTQFVLPRLRAAKGDPLHGGALMRISLRRDAGSHSPGLCIPHLERAPRARKHTGIGGQPAPVRAKHQRVRIPPCKLCHHLSIGTI